MHALSVDVEEYFHVSNFAGTIDRARWDAMPSRVEDATRRLLDLFDERGCRGTFFVLGWVAERRPNLVAEIAARGHEIACHGYGHELLYEIGPGRFRADLRRARGAIEDACGASPDGYRAPSYTVTRRSLWALPILAEEGFRYDSSIFPVHHPRYGIPGFAPPLVEIDLGGGLALVELALTAVPLGRWALPVAGGAYLRLLPAPLFRWGFRRAAAAGAPAVLYVHPWELDPEQPRLRASRLTQVRHYHNLAHTEARLAALLREHAFAPLVEVIGERRREGRLPVRKLGELFGSDAACSAPDGERGVSG